MGQKKRIFACSLVQNTLLPSLPTLSLSITYRPFKLTVCGTSTKVTAISSPTTAVKRAPSQVPQGLSRWRWTAPLIEKLPLALPSVTHMSTGSYRDTGTVTVTWQPHNLPLETHHMQLLYTELVCFKPF